MPFLARWCLRTWPLLGPDSQRLLGRAMGTDPSVAQCHHPQGHVGWPGLGAVSFGMDPVEGLGSALRCERLQSVLWLQGCRKNPQPLSSAGDRRILWVFHENSPQVPWRRDAGEPELGYSACGMPGDLRGSVCPQVGWGHRRKPRGARPWMKQQCWHGERRNARAGGQIQGLMPHVLLFSPATVPAGPVVVWHGPPASRKVGRMRLGCRDRRVLLLVCTNGRWKGEGSLTAPWAGRSLQAQLKSPINALHCFQQND